MVDKDLNPANPNKDPDDPNNPPGGDDDPLDDPYKDPGQDDLDEPGQGTSTTDDLSDEELARMILQDDQEWLSSHGLGKFKSMEQLAEAYKKGESEGSRTHNRVKKIAEHYKVDPDGLISHLEKQMGEVPVRDARSGASDPTKIPATYGSSAEIKQLQGAIGRANLDRLFDKWQARKEAKEEKDIPDSLQSSLEKLLPLVAQGKTEEELAEMGVEIFDEAYDFHIFRTGKKKESDARIKNRLTKKKRQLGVVPSTRGGSVPVSDKEAAAAFGFDSPP